MTTTTDLGRAVSINVYEIPGGRWQFSVAGPGGGTIGETSSEKMAWDRAREAARQVAHLKTVTTS